MSKFWGFNDCSPWAENGTVAWLESKVYCRPPVRGDMARLMVRPVGGAARQVAETDCWNFPQGARQQWIGDSADLVVNLRDGDDLRSSRINTVTGAVTELQMPVYTILKEKNTGLGLNFGRIQRLGGYGYAGLDDCSKNSTAPVDDGIWSVPLDGSAPSLLLDLAEVASFGGTDREHDSGHHYLTHVLPSPDESSIAFLHRFWLPDGGINTRLMSLHLESQTLHLWAEGYLSHFDWHDEDCLVIWGRGNQAVGRARQGAGLMSKIPRPLIHLAKNVLRPVLGKSGAMRLNYLVLRRHESGIGIMAPDSLTMDGHPSFLPADRDWMLSDTYPDDKGTRELFLMHFQRREKILIAKLKNDSREVDTSRMEEAVSSIDKVAMANFKPKVFAFNRSGLYCDFHPRWKRDGSAVAFDANHEGSRHMYSVDIPASLLSDGPLGQLALEIKTIA